MKLRTIILAGLFTSIPLAHSAEVRLEGLRDFDQETHRISVNIEARVTGGCLPDPGKLRASYAGILELLGFSVAPEAEGDLEFAVSVIGFTTSGPGSCGVKVRTMARQVPIRSILRLSPSSDNNQFTLWVTETVISGPRDEMQALLQEQSRLDVFQFRAAWQEPKR